MKKSDVDYSLYLVTDRELMTAPTLEKAVEDALVGGCTLVQLREKAVSSRAFYDVAVSLKRVTDAYHVPLIINDRVDIALAVDAAGVHVGQSDLPAAAVRKIIGPDKILGVSAGNVAQALLAVEDGADYLGVGAMFVTSTKTDAKHTAIEELARIRAVVSKPIVAIGGIGAETAPQLRGSGVDGLAVVSAILAKPDIEAAARELLSLFQQQIKTK